MKKFILLSIWLCAMVLSMSASPVLAQNVMWVSATGSGNTCSTGAPCGTFQAAINAGATEIHCLNSGNYGPFTITASITIDCGAGNIGTVSVAGNGVTAIVIDASSAATIVLRHLSLNGNGTALTGIGPASFPSGTLTIEDCTIQGFVGGVGTGIIFAPSSGRGLLQVSNSQIMGNYNGIFVNPQGAQIASLMLNRVEVTGNAGVGLYMSGAGIIAGTMRESVVGANGTTGVYSNASQAYFTVEESSIVDNLTFGILTASAGSVLNVGTSTIGGNGTGVGASAGSLISFGNNQMSANGSNGTFTSTTPLR
jgi:hypothetical protein